MSPITLVILFAVLQVADSLTTLAILKRGGRELNPVMRSLFEDLGAPFALVLVKSGLVVLVWFGLAEAPWVLAGIDAIYLGVVVHNLLALRRMS